MAVEPHLPKPAPAAPQARPVRKIGDRPATGRSASPLDMPRLFAPILGLGLLGLAFFFAVVWMQRRFVFLNRSDRPVGIA